MPTSSNPLSLPSKANLTLDAARQIILVAQAEALRNQLHVTIAVVDDGGHLLHLSRMDGAHVGTVEVAIAKARTSAFFRKPTLAFADGLSGGASGILSLPNMLPLPGGVPLSFEDSIVGAIGVSGATSDMDAKVARAGADLLLDRT